MNNEIILLSTTAASVGFLHTLLGPDHYIPFIALAEAGKWSRKKTIFITTLCGIGHVSSSIILGMIGILLGTALFSLQSIENFRGNIAGWFLITFGLLYTLYGIRLARKNKTHVHLHPHIGEGLHSHMHSHGDEHAHFHEEKKKNTPWILFLIFVFGPCEPLIPLVMYPASQNNTPGVITVSVVFSLITIVTMLSVVLISQSGIKMLPVKKFEKYMHSLAGFVILLCGIGVQFLGL
jgi:nickel/cobalt transporter (NicO) family protein